MKNLKQLQRIRLSGGFMFTNITTLVAACSMISCASLAVGSDGKRPTSGNDSPLTRGNGAGSGSNSGSDRGNDGDRDHGLNGERWQDRIPRQPMWFISAGTANRSSNVHPEDNSRGLAVWWRGENAVDELVRRMHNGYDNGARWFFINRPMGTPGNTEVPGASWLTMDSNKRDDLPMKLSKELLDEFDEPVHVVWFIGSEMSDPREYPGRTPNRASDFYELGKNDTWEQLVGSRVTLGGWISTGASGIAFDASSPLDERQHFIDLFEQLNGAPFNLGIYGEAYPLMYSNNRSTRDGHGTPILDVDAIESMPWIGTTNYIDGRWPNGGQSDSFPLDEDLTRMFVWFERSNLGYGNENQRIDLVNAYMDRGLIPITRDPVMFREAINRMNPSYSRAGNDSNSSNSSRPQARSSSRRSNASSPSSRTGSRTAGQSTVRNKGTSKIVPSQTLPQRYQHIPAATDTE
ncbi:MAG: hypothetical protein P1U42_06685 [Phycisphaerales bacterium]|nr:hypothetical protein [Phycisphaerales bacterium]